MLKLAGIDAEAAAKTHDELKKEIRRAAEFKLHKICFSPFEGRKRPRQDGGNDAEDEDDT